MRLRLLFAVTAILLLPAASPSDPAARFGARESIADISLSPDGRRIAYIAPGPESSSALYTVPLASGEPVRALVADGKPQKLSWCRWTAPERLVCRISALFERAGYLLPIDRMVAVDADGGNLKQLGESDSDYARYLSLFGGSVIDWLPGADGEVLWQRMHVPEVRERTRLERKEEGLGVERLDTRTLKTRTVQRPVRTAGGFASDGLGNVRLMAVAELANASGQRSGTTRYSYRTRGSDEWRPFSTYDSATREGMYPLAIDGRSDVAYAAKKVDGRFAIFRVALDGTMKEDLVFAHPQVDVDDLVQIGKAQRPVGVSYATDVREVIYFDPEIDALAKGLAQALPKLPIIRVVDASDDERTLLLYAGSDDDAGRYYTYDKQTRQLAEILAARPQLEGLALATVKPITFPAGDGTPIPGYLTLPPTGDGRNLPAIVLPHGGPEARDEWGFDWLAQYFASRGYAVLQPNFRGSAGYGDEWFERNGFQSWRTAVGDVADAGRWLVREGIADPAKLGIVGWSYGGYAALQANVLAPGLFKSVVAIAPVTDLPLLKEESRGWTDFRLVREFIGSGPHLTEGSPVANADAIGAPVLLFHGTMDRNVGVKHSRAMADRLKDRGAKVKYVEFDGLDHYLDSGEARERLLRESDEWLRAGFAG